MEAVNSSLRDASGTVQPLIHHKAFLLALQCRQKRVIISWSGARPIFFPVSALYLRCLHAIPLRTTNILINPGRVPAYAYTIKFQKQGLPHAHILIILHPEDRFFTAAEVDAAVSAEIPDQHLFPNLYATVTRCMLHGNCSQYTITTIGTPPPCWDSEKNACSKRFPKEFCNHTVFQPDFGYPKYR